MNDDDDDDGDGDDDGDDDGRLCCVGAIPRRCPPDAQMCPTANQGEINLFQKFFHLLKSKVKFK